MTSHKIPLVLGTPRSAWSVLPHHGSQVVGLRALRKIRDKIVERDKYTCQACGWVSRQWQEIHHRNHDHGDHREKNLVTLCPLCHQVFHLPQASATGGGSIIWLPEVEQRELNLICIALFVALRHPKGKWRGAAQAIQGAFEARSGMALDFLKYPASSTPSSELRTSGPVCDPGYLAQALLRLRPDQFENRAHLTRALRLLPHPSRFQDEIEYWEKACFPSMDSNEWDALLPAHLDPARGGLTDHDA